MTEPVVVVETPEAVVVEAPPVEVIATPDEVIVKIDPTTTTPVKIVVEELAHAQAVPVPAHEMDFYPPHPPRSETREYVATHHLLVNVLDTPCRICGVKKSTLKDPSVNVHKSTALETHHWPIQREFTDACDYRKVMRDFATVVDQESFLKFVDSPANMYVLCSFCHRSTAAGIHHAVANDWIVHKYLFDGYVLTDKAANAVTDLAIDQAIVDADVALGERM